MFPSDNSDRIAAAGGVQRVVDAMVAHVGNVRVQTAGCHGLRNLASRNSGA